MSYRSEYLAKAMQSGGMGFDYARFNGSTRYNLSSYSTNKSYSQNLNNY